MIDPWEPADAGSCDTRHRDGATLLAPDSEVAALLTPDSDVAALPAPDSDVAALPAPDSEVAGHPATSGRPPKDSGGAHDLLGHLTDAAPDGPLGDHDLSPRLGRGA